MCGSRHYGNHHWARRSDWEDRETWDDREAASSPMATPAAPATPSDQLLVSDADRQVVIDRLSRHTADGRLTLDEFEGRVDEVVRARTRAQLEAALRDLPSLEPPMPPWRGQRRRPGIPVPLLVVAAIVAVTVVSQAFVWVLIPVGFWFFGGCHGRARRRTGDQDRQLTTV